MDRGAGRTRIGRVGWAAVLPLCALLGPGCGGSAPAAATALATAGRSLRVISGDTHLPVPGAEIVVGGHQWTTDEAGQVHLPAGAAGGIDVTAEGFLSRQTRLGPEALTLWPIGPGRGSDYVRAIIYQSSAAGGAEGRGADQPLQRLRGRVIVVAPSRVLLRDVRVMAAHREAVEILNDATAGAVVVSLGGSGAGAAIFATDLDTELPWIAAAYKQLRGNEITGGRLVFGSLGAARNPRYLAHELGHALGLQHSLLPTDLMYFEAREGGASSFTDAERLTIRLLLQRPAGNHYPDRDRAEEDAGGVGGVLATIIESY